MKPSLEVTEETKIALPRREMCNLSHLLGIHLKISNCGPVTQVNPIRPKRRSMRVTPLIPNPSPVRLFAGPPTRGAIRRLPQQLARSMYVEHRVRNCPGKPHP